MPVTTSSQCLTGTHTQTPPAPASFRFLDRRRLVSSRPTPDDSTSTATARLVNSSAEPWHAARRRSTLLPVPVPVPARMQLQQRHYLLCSIVSPRES